MDINKISVGDIVTYRDGKEGIVTSICERVIDGVNHPHTDGILARARIFTDIIGGGRRYITHRADGVSHDHASTDIVYLKQKSPTQQSIKE